MAEQKFPAGARVRLKSHGPEMTVVDYAVHGEFDGDLKKYHCRWFDNKGELKENYFTEPELDRVD